jgi:hypothetical protein
MHNSSLFFLFLLFLSIIASLICFKLPNIPAKSSMPSPSQKLQNHRIALRSMMNDWMQELIKTSAISSDDIAKVKFDYDKARGKDLVLAAQPIKRDEVIMTIPISICIDSSYIQTILGKSLTPSLFRTGEYGLLALYLVAEKVSAKSVSGSKYSKYVASLDSKPSGLFGWSNDLIEEFSKSTTRDVKNQIAAAEIDYNFITSMAGAKVIPPDIREKMTKELFFWALGTVKARAISIEKKLTLVPGRRTTRSSSCCNHEIA